MTDDKARRVKVELVPCEEGEFIKEPTGEFSTMVEDDPNGTHMLVPVEVWKRVNNHANVIKHEAWIAILDWVYHDNPHRHEILEKQERCKDSLIEINRALAEIGGEDDS